MTILAWAMSIAVALVLLVANLGYADLSFFVRRLPGRDLTGHVGLFGVLSFLVVSAVLRAARPRWRWTHALAALAVFVSVEELSQAWIATRTFSLLDLSASLVGISLGCLAALGWVRARRPG